MRLMEMEQPESETLSLRSEKVRDIMDKMPSWFVVWGGTVILAIIVIALFFSWLIKYPEVVVSEITITSVNPPLKISTKASGNLRVKLNAPGQIVEKDQYIAIIENPAITDDVVLLKTRLEDFQKRYNTHQRIDIHYFPENLSVGNLQSLYHEFLISYQEVLLFRDINRSENQIQFLKRQIQNQEALLKSHSVLDDVKKEELKLFKRKSERDSRLFSQQAISEKDYEDTQIVWLNKQDAYESFRADFVKIRSQIHDLNNQVNEIIFNETETDKRLELSLWKQYYFLMAAIIDWEQTYVLKAPIRGTLEYLNFWKNNQFVQIGEDVFSIIPENTTLLGHAEMPTLGAGKVVVGQQVKITLANFPYKEFGAVTGIVKEISPLTKESVTLLGKENFYLVSVDLPQGLKTNFNKDLAFKHDMVGVAQIITKDRRFIERVFENIIYIFKD